MPLSSIRLGVRAQIGECIQLIHWVQTTQYVSARRRRAGHQRLLKHRVRAVENIRSPFSVPLVLHLSPHIAHGCDDGRVDGGAPAW